MQNQKDKPALNDVKSRWRGAIRRIRGGDLQDKLVEVMKSKLFKTGGKVVERCLVEICIVALMTGLLDGNGMEVVRTECKIQTGSPHYKDTSVKSIPREDQHDEFKKPFGATMKPDCRAAGKSIKCVTYCNSTVDGSIKCETCGNIVWYKTDVCGLLKCMCHVGDVGMADQPKHKTSKKDLVMARQYVDMANQVMMLADKFKGNANDEQYFTAARFAERLLDAAMDKVHPHTPRSDLPAP